MNFHNIIYETHYLYCFILMSLISGMLGMCIYIYIYVYIHKSFMTFKLLQGISIAFLLLLFLLIIVGV